MPFKKRKRTWPSTHTASPSRTGGIRLMRKQPRGRRRNARVVVPRNKLGFPTSMVSTLRYTERKEFLPTNGNTKVWTFSANSPYDPDVTGTGHQARGFDEYSDLYKNYTVTSSRILINWMYEGYNGPSKTAGSVGTTTSQVIEAHDSDVPALAPSICGIFRSNAPYGSSTPVEQQMEQDRTTWTVLNPQSSCRTSSSQARLSDFFGKQDLVAAEGYSGLTGPYGTGSSPDNPVYFHIFSARGANDYPDGECKIVGYVTIEYRVTFTDPKALQQS